MVTRQRAELAQLLRAAYAIGGNAPLKLLLAQDRVADGSATAASRRNGQPWSWLQRRLSAALLLALAPLPSMAQRAEAQTPTAPAASADDPDSTESASAKVPLDEIRRYVAVYAARARPRQGRQAVRRDPDPADHPRGQRAQPYARTRLRLYPHQHLPGRHRRRFPQAAALQAQAGEPRP
ncbi:hypothetical protein NB693_26055 [Pantoea ananatis]|uniref:hypothetical protein n=1 Tax=Pantoea ananas TaxID=553 RepID=UPI00221F1348|nr:hypothetical protein [Pantoea ananatis]